MTYIKCTVCGKFCKPVHTEMIYSGVLKEPDHEEFWCEGCVKQEIISENLSKLSEV